MGPCLEPFAVTHQTVSSQSPRTEFQPTTKEPPYEGRRDHKRTLLEYIRIRMGQLYFGKLSDNKSRHYLEGGTARISSLTTTKQQKYACSAITRSTKTERHRGRKREPHIWTNRGSPNPRMPPWCIFLWWKPVTLILTLLPQHDVPPPQWRSEMLGKWALQACVPSVSADRYRFPHLPRCHFRN